MNPSPGTVTLAAVMGAVAVALGAFGAHALRHRVSPEDLEIWRTAVLYHMVHAVTLLVVGVAGDRLRLGRVAAALFTVGILVFAGTLYALVLSGTRWLGAITPIGGVCLIAGWATLAVGAATRPAPRG